MKLILDGDFHEIVVNETHRGKGLPALKQVLIRNQISNLHIISNDVYVNVDKEDYRLLDCNLKGTFIYWELNKNNVHHEPID